MRQFLNYNSAALIIGTFGLLVGFVAWNHRRNLRVLALVALVVAVVVAGYLSVRSGPSSVAALADVDAMLSQGRPVLVELYSDF